MKTLIVFSLLLLSYNSFAGRFTTGYGSVHLSKHDVRRSMVGMHGPQAQQLMSLRNPFPNGHLAGAITESDGSLSVRWDSDTCVNCQIGNGSYVFRNQEHSLFQRVRDGESVTVSYRYIGKGSRPTSEDPFGFIDLTLARNNQGGFRVDGTPAIFTAPIFISKRVRHFEIAGLKPTNSANINEMVFHFLLEDGTVEQVSMRVRATQNGRLAQWDRNMTSQNFDPQNGRPLPFDVASFIDCNRKQIVSVPEAQPVGGFATSPNPGSIN